MAVFITGASSGIGEACARVFARANFNLVLAARREDRLTDLAEQLTSQFRVQVDTYSLDVRSPEAVSQLVEGNPRVFSRISVVINNAGLAKGIDPLQDGKIEDWDAMIDTNVKGLLYVTRALLPGMIARKDGHIVNVGSVAGHWAYPKGGVYCASKFAVHALTQGLRMDLHGTGIRVSELSPGMVETEFSQVRLGDADKAKELYQGFEPLTPTDVAEAALWCVQRPKRVNIQEIVLFPTAQSAIGMVDRKS
jgi:serine 3-dehydrogenase